MEPVVKTINFIHSKALNHHQFQQLLLDIQLNMEIYYTKL